MVQSVCTWYDYVYSKSEGLVCCLTKVNSTQTTGHKRHHIHILIPITQLFPVIYILYTLVYLCSIQLAGQ